MSAVTAIVAITGILAAGIIYGTDAFCALVQRPALTALDDATLTAVMGRIHQYGDRRLPAPGIIGVLAAAVTTTVATIRGSVPGAIAAGVALVCMLAWLRLYLHVAAHINRALTAAAMAHETPDNSRRDGTASSPPERCSWVSPSPAPPQRRRPITRRPGAIASLVRRQPPGHGRRGSHELVRQRACGLRVPVRTRRSGVVESSLAGLRAVTLSARRTTGSSRPSPSIGSGWQALTGRLVDDPMER